jgi:hypothetical protein
MTTPFALCCARVRSMVIVVMGSTHQALFEALNLALKLKIFFLNNFNEN